VKAELSGASCYIQKVGTATPDYALCPRESVDLFRQACRDARMARMLPRIVRLTGIERRYLAVMDPLYRPYGAEGLYRPLQQQPDGPGMGERNGLFARLAGPLVLRALREFPAERLAEVSMLITASCTHASAPGLELPVFLHTPVPRSADRWNLGFMGCSAGLAGLRLGRPAAATGREVLIVACELSSLHFQYTDAIDQLTANVLFADGAAAVMLSARPSAARLVDCHCVALPEQADQMVWFADNHGLRLNLSQDLPDTLAAHVAKVVDEFLAANGVDRAGIQHWIVHPGGPQILDAVAEALALPADALQLSRGVLRNYGNMSSPTSFFILKELLDLRASGRCLAMAFGPGLTVELVLLDINHEAF
jgi:prepilin-type processing-associated H-X9-DG protein